MLTVEQFASIPNPPGGRYELHHGELVFVPPPDIPHGRIQDRLVDLLKAACAPAFYASKEFPFRPLPEHEVWVADVALSEKARVMAIEAGWYEGSPYLVIEVLSPSNTRREMKDREEICFAGGCEQFWLVDPKVKSVTVSTPDGNCTVYECATDVPLARFGSVIRVDEIFDF